MRSRTWSATVFSLAAATLALGCTGFLRPPTDAPADGLVAADAVDDVAPVDAVDVAGDDGAAPPFVCPRGVTAAICGFYRDGGWALILDELAVRADDPCRRCILGNTAATACFGNIRCAQYLACATGRCSPGGPSQWHTCCASDFDECARCSCWTQTVGGCRDHIARCADMSACQ